jgi:hypothetical protein
MVERKCKRCDKCLSDQDVIKIKIEDDAWEIFPLTLCPECFKKQMLGISGSRKKLKLPNTSKLNA